MRSKQHLNYKYKCFNGCRAVSDVRQKWNTGQSWGCCWNNFWGLKAKTDRKGVKLHPVWKQDSLYWYPLELSEDTALLCWGLIPSAPVMQWPVHACFNISALPGSDFFLLRLSPAQLACMSLRTEKARSNLSCECVFAESRGGLDTSERSGCEITAEARKEQKYWSILLVCVYFFFPFLWCFGWFVFSGPQAIIELNQCETSEGLKVVGEEDHYHCQFSNLMILQLVDRFSIRFFWYHSLSDAALADAGSVRINQTSANIYWLSWHLAKKDVRPASFLRC